MIKVRNRMAGKVQNLDAFDLYEAGNIRNFDFLYLPGTGVVDVKNLVMNSLHNWTLKNEQASEIGLGLPDDRSSRR